MAANPKDARRSFGGGEVTPEFWGNISDAKYQTGLAVCRNFVVKPHGPVENRAGFAFVRAVKNEGVQTQLIPFTFSQDQTLVIEFGAGYFRFYTEGATVLSGGLPYEIANPYFEADLGTVKITQSNDVVTLVHPKYEPRELRRLGATNWTLTIISFASPLSPPAGVSAVATPKASSPGVPTLQSYAVTAISNGGLDESAASTDTQSADGASGSTIYSITKANPGLLEIDLGGTSLAVNSDVYVSGVGGMAQLNNRFFKINTIVTLFDGEGFPYACRISLKDAGVPVDTTGYTTYVGGGTVANATAGGSKCSNNLFDTGAYNTVTWAAAPGAERYNVYKLYRGLLGYIGQTTSLTFTDDNIAPDLSNTPPITDTPFVGTGNYPGAVGYFEQRRWFGGSDNNPGVVNATRTGTEANLAYSIPAAADDAVSFRVASRERNTIRHIVPMENLVLLTNAAEWRVAGASGAITGDETPSVKPQSYIGSGQAQPALVNANLIFAAARGGHLRELAFSQDAGGYITGDLSLRAPHLFDGFDIIDISYMKAPVPIVWVVSTSGKLLGITYIPEQSIGAWHRHDTQDGIFEAIAVVAEGEEDVLYAIVKRNLAGVPRRFVERMATRRQTTPEAAFFVDAGATFSSASPVTTLAGLDWLEGCTVAVLADGAPQSRKVVAGGAITLDSPANVVTVGLPIEADFQTLPLAFEVQGYGAGRPKSVTEAIVRVFASSFFRVGQAFDKLVDAKMRTTEALGDPTAIQTREVSVKPLPGWTDGGQACIRQDQPLPLTIVSLSVDAAVGG